MNPKTSEKILLAGVLCPIVILFIAIIARSPATYDTGDGIRHYIISRYSWNHSYLFLDHWGKPFFTLVSSPFSRFGLLGINAFNLVCFILSSVLCYSLA